MGAAIFFHGVFVLGAIATGIVAGAMATYELSIPGPSGWRLALGAATASIVMMPWPPINLVDGAGKSFLLLLIAALPSLILFRPTAPNVSTPVLSQSRMRHSMMSQRGSP